MKQSLRSYFEITKKEWNGMVVMLIVIAAIIAAPYIWHYFHREPAMDLKEFNKIAAQLKDANGNPAEEYAADDTRNPHPTLFNFNPNKLPAEQWAKLGLSAKQIGILKNYEAKGGKFYTKTDLQKIYSITPEDYKRLEGYITLPAQFASTKTDEVVEINAADSTRLTQVKGIGPSFASRIIKYRSQLGGFIKKEQLMEIYGIDTAKYQEITPHIIVNAARIKKIHINTVTVDELRPFPYLNFKQMNAMVQYRAQHGDYHSMEDLRQVAILDAEILRKIAPYLTFK
ncbi:helix-hairpin-helix domain-containing protein [Mucilaginibacter sp. AW1-3]